MVDTRRIEKWPQEGVGASFLINSKYNILLDSYLLRTNSFYHFYNEWICNSINYNKPLYVLCLSKKDFDSTCNLSGVAALLCTDVINCGKTLKPIKGDWIYISNSPDSIDIIRQSIRNEKIFIRAYHLGF